MSTLEQNLAELESAEDFLNYFDIPFDTHVVQVNRLHILQRFHDYLEEKRSAMPESDEEQKKIFKDLLLKAYEDFINSDALTEKVFKVFNVQAKQEAFVPLESLFR